MDSDGLQSAVVHRARVREVFTAFLILGLTSFGGPVAHLGYFRTEFVQRRGWLSDEGYAQLVALCQFLPGPASSQVGFALGLMRAGPLGAAAAWTAFTLPSAVLLIAFAWGATSLDGTIAHGLIHGLKVAAVPIVAHALWSMSRTLCPDVRRAAIALAAFVVVSFSGGPLGQVTAIALGAAIGACLCRSRAPTDGAPFEFPVTAVAGNVAGLLFAALLLGLPLAVWLYPSALLEMVDGFYRAGALVFGGGHVVLPLLEAEVVKPGGLAAKDFLAGYGATQAVPGPLFTFAAYLGAVMDPFGNSILSAALALVMIFAPGMLLLIAVLPRWSWLARSNRTRSWMRGANAAVVGILAAALYHPVWTSAIVGPAEFVLALAGFLLLAVWKLPAWFVVGVLALGGVLIRS